MQSHCLFYTVFYFILFLTGTYIHSDECVTIEREREKEKHTREAKHVKRTRRRKNESSNFISMVYVRSKQQQQRRRQVATKGIVFVGVCAFTVLVFSFVTVTLVNVLHFYHFIVFDNDSSSSVVGVGVATLPIESQSKSAFKTNKKSIRENNTPMVSPQTTENNTTTTIAYAVTVTGCGTDPLMEGAAVLQHSIRTRASRHPYGAHFVVFYPPSASACVEPLQALGFELLPRQVMVNVSDIRGEFLRTQITSNGCCGEKELLKLEAYTLIQYPIVVHLDLDVLILKSMDDLYDAMLLQRPIPPAILQSQSQSQSIPHPIRAFFTYDYNMVQPHVRYKPVQGGFLVLRPSLQVYQEFKDIVLEGDFRQGKGWGGQVGPFYGSMTFQGIIPYYYNVVKGGTQSLELNRCIYNQMADNPRTGKTVHDQVSGTCRTNTETCEDCRERPMDDIVTTHYTLCQKPWWCVPHTANVLQHRLCRQLTRVWYQVRSELERSWGRSGQGPGTYDVEQFYGYCTKAGKDGYVPMALP